MSSGPISRIFVVDDEAAITTLATTLHMKGFSAMFFTSPIEALEAARLDKPDLLITNVVMPDQSGVDLAISMRAQFSEMKILLFSGQSATWHLLEQGLNLGYHCDVPDKPVHPTMHHPGDEYGGRFIRIDRSESDSLPRLRGQIENSPHGVVINHDDGAGVERGVRYSKGHAVGRPAIKC
jgi:CheY-like chemotaxis protein